MGAACRAARFMPGPPEDESFNEGWFRPSPDRAPAGDEKRSAGWRDLDDKIAEAVAELRTFLRDIQEGRYEVTLTVRRK